MTTVAAQLDAVATSAPQWVSPFVANVVYLARLTGRSDDFRELLEEWEPPLENVGGDQ